jgi:hypothetical protein
MPTAVLVNYWLFGQEWVLEGHSFSSAKPLLEWQSESPILAVMFEVLRWRRSGGSVNTEAHREHAEL